MICQPAKLITVFLTLALLPLCGCSSGADQAASRETASAAYAEALAKQESGDHSGALEKFNEALDGGWIGGDTRTQGFLQRSVSLAATGDYQSAQADLDKAKQRQGNPDDVLTVQSYVLRKQGKKREAAAAFKQAKRFNRSVKEIAD